MSELSSSTDTPAEPSSTAPADTEPAEPIPDASPELENALNGQAGSGDSQGDLATAQQQADAVSDQFPAYLKNNAVEADMNDVTPSETPAGSDGGSQGDLARGLEPGDAATDQVPASQENSAVNAGLPDVPPELVTGLSQGEDVTSGSLVSPLPTPDVLGDDGGRSR